MFALRRARLGVHHHIGGHNFADTFFDGVAKLMDLFETGGASHAYRGMHKVAIPSAADPHAIDIQNTLHAGHRASDLLTEAFWRGVHESVESAPAKPRSNPQNDACDRQTRDGVGARKPGQMPGFTGPNQSYADDDNDGAPDICRKMQSVRFYCFAMVFACHVTQCFRAGYIDR